MPIATGLALGLGALSAGGALGGAALSANAAGNAASTQANAANRAAELQFEAEQQALQFQMQQWQQSQTNAAPWLQTGGSAELALGQLLGLPSPSSGITPGSPFPASGTSTVPSAPNPGMVGPNGTNGSQFSMMGLSPHPGASTGSPMQPVRGTDGETAFPGQSNGTPVMGGTFGMPAPGASTGAPRSPGAPGAASGAPGGPGGPLGGNLQPFAPWTTPFVAPTDVTEQNDPGYKFRMSQGLGALENSAAARGGLLSGNTAKAEQDYAQGLASNEYANVYGRSLGEYQQNYNIFQQNQANQWNRLASLAGMGQTQAGQLNSAGLGFGQNVGNILLGGSNAIGQNLNNAAAATASGYVGGANAYGSGLSGLTGNLGQLLMMSQLLNKGGIGPIPAAS